ncbi:hypothetical protein BTVI_13796 [Pitangus sulphuratus]|nr:hypothetical protein BTVI_13796 [Pitangus sulphuratus]
MNGFLKLQLRRPGEGSFKKWMDNLDEAVPVLNNHMISPTLTLLILMKGDQEKVTQVARDFISVISGTLFTVKSIKGGYVLLNTQTQPLEANQDQWVRTDVTLSYSGHQEDILRYMVLLPELSRLGLTLLNPVLGDTAKPLLIGLKNTTGHPITVPPMELTDVNHIYSFPVMPIAQKWFAGGWVWHQTPGDESPVAVEIVAADDSQAVTIAIESQTELKRVPTQHLR